MGQGRSAGWRTVKRPRQLSSALRWAGSWRWWPRCPRRRSWSPAPRPARPGRAPSWCWRCPAAPPPWTRPWSVCSGWQTWSRLPSPSACPGGSACLRSSAACPPGLCASRPAGRGSFSNCPTSPTLWGWFWPSFWVWLWFCSVQSAVGWGSCFCTDPECFWAGFVSVRSAPWTPLSSHSKMPL